MIRFLSGKLKKHTKLSKIVKISEIFNRLVFPMNFIRFCHPMTLSKKRTINQKKDMAWYTVNFSGMHFLPVLFAGPMSVHQIDPLSQELWARLTLGMATCNCQGIPTSEHSDISYNVNQYTYYLIIKNSLMMW